MLKSCRFCGGRANIPSTTTEKRQKARHVACVDCYPRGSTRDARGCRRLLRDGCGLGCGRSGPGQEKNTMPVCMPNSTRREWFFHFAGAHALLRPLQYVDTPTPTIQHVHLVAMAAVNGKRPLELTTEVGLDARKAKIGIST